MYRSIKRRFIRLHATGNRNITHFYDRDPGIGNYKNFGVHGQNMACSSIIPCLQGHRQD